MSFLYSIVGVVSVLAENKLIIETGSIGVSINVPNHLVAHVKLDESVKLYTYVHMSDNNFELYGFETISQQHLFTLLVAISGVGPKSALQILNIASVEQLVSWVETADDKSISQAKGIGLKSARRIIIELKDKTPQFTSDSIQTTPVVNQQLKLAKQALINLGIHQRDTDSLLIGIDLTLSAGEMVKQALRKNTRH